jgi:hypothetical protein
MYAPQMVRGLAPLLALAACAKASAALDAMPGDTAPLPDAPVADAPVVDAPPVLPVGSKVFAADRLHRIDITVAEQYLDKLEWDVVNRVPCTFTFDGERIDNVGIRKKGGFGSVASIEKKTGFSIKLDQFVPAQKLDGLKRFVLNSAVEDRTFLSETVGYLSHRAFGLVAPLTSHAQMTFNGVDKGIFVIKEAIAGDFLKRVFGKNYDHGNVYEGFRHQAEPLLGDFVTHPEELDLKDEVSEGRSRADINALAQAIRETPDNDFAAVVATKLEFDAYMKAIALDTILGFWDSYGYFLNNYYLYHSPASNKFVYIPQGMDQLRYADPGMAQGRLVQRILEIPAMRDRFEREKTALRSNWPVAVLVARIDQVAAVLAMATPGPQTNVDLGYFHSNFDRVRATVANLGQ